MSATFGAAFADALDAASSSTASSSPSWTSEKTECV